MLVPTGDKHLMVKISGICEPFYSTMKYMDAFDEVSIFIELTGLFPFVRGLLKFEFVYFNLFRLIYYKFQNNPQGTTILFSFPVAVFPRVIILSVFMVDVEMECLLKESVSNCTVTKRLQMSVPRVSDQCRSIISVPGTSTAPLIRSA